MCSNESVPLFLSPVQAGFPSPAQDYVQDSLDLNAYLIKNRAATYCLRVSGESMSGAGILPGDILVVDRSVRPKAGDIMVAEISGEFTVKRLCRTNGVWVLHPENPEFEDLPVTEETVCFGTVVGVVRKV